MALYSSEMLLYFPATLTLLSLVTFFFKKTFYPFKVSFFINLLGTITVGTVFLINKYNLYLVYMNYEKAVPVIVIIACLSFMLDIFLISKKQEITPLNKDEEVA